MNLYTVNLKEIRPDFDSILRGQVNSYYVEMIVGDHVSGYLRDAAGDYLANCGHYLAHRLGLFMGSVKVRWI